MSALHFQGTVISIGAESANLTPIGCIVGYDRTGGDKNEIDATCSDSLAKEFIFGLIDFGALSVEVNYNPEDSGWGIAEASEASTDEFFFEIAFPNKPDPLGKGTIKTFKGYVTSTSDSGSVDDKLAGTINIKISGPITQVPPTPGT